MKKTDQPGSLYALYSIYDFPLINYAYLVCNDDLKKLIISGNPNNATLNDAKRQMIEDFAELSGNHKISSINRTVKNIYKAEIEELSAFVAYSLCKNGVIDEHFCSRNGLNKNTEKELLLKQIESIYKAKQAAKANLLNTLFQLTSSNEDGNIKISDFVEHLIILSKSLGYSMNINTITVAEYAAAIKTIARYEQNNK